MIEPEDNNESAQYLLDEECAEFQALMSERIGAGEDLQSYEHMQTCERCRGLLRDLESIVFAVKELMEFEVEPPPEVWSGIDKAIKRHESNGFHAVSEDLGENPGEDPLSPAFN